MLSESHLGAAIATAKRAHVHRASLDDLRCPRCNSVQRTRGAVILRIAPQVRQRYSRCSAASTKQIAALLAAVASDAVTFLEIPQNFALLRLFHRGCGRLSRSARSEALENCQPPGAQHKPR